MRIACLQPAGRWVRGRKGSVSTLQTPRDASAGVAQVWPYAESLEGATVPSPTKAPAAAALVALAAEHNIAIACTLMESVAGGRGRSGRDVWNTCVLAQADGTLHPSRPPKAHPANFEWWAFAPGERRCGRAIDAVLPVHIGDAGAVGTGASGSSTREGSSRVVSATVRLGVSICYDTYWAATHAQLAAQRPDVILLPHCAPIPRVSPFMSRGEVATYRAMIANTRAALATHMRRSVLYTNQTGVFDTVTPAPLLRPFERWMTRDCRFGGDAAVLSGGDHGGGGAGAVLACCSSDEADVAVANVALPAVLACEAVAGEVESGAAVAPLTDAAGLAAVGRAAVAPRSFSAAFPLNAWAGGRAYRAASHLRAAVAGTGLAV
jgi:predicted amidohydrolase